MNLTKSHKSNQSRARYAFLPKFVEDDRCWVWLEWIWKRTAYMGSGFVLVEYYRHIKNLPPDTD